MTENERVTSDQVSLGAKGTFEVVIDYESMDGISYKGTLTFKLPTVMQTMAMGAPIAAFIQGQYPAGKIDPEMVPQVIKDIAEAVVTIEMLMVKGPEWAVKIRECVDFDLPIHVSQRYRAERYRFRNAGKRPAGANSGTAE